MKTFKNFFIEKVVLSVKEPIEIIGAGKADAKVDTGNEAFNVLHGVDIKEENGEAIFKTINNKVLKKKIIDSVSINIGSGNIEKRPVVEVEFILHGKNYKRPFSLADRSTNDEPILLGEIFLKEIDAVVDVNI